MNLALGEADLLEYKQEVEKCIFIEYSDIRFIEYECETFDVTIVEKTFDIKIMYKINASEENMKLFLEKVERAVKIIE